MSEKKMTSSGECPGQHCSAKAAIINAMCKEMGNAGRPVWVEHNGSYCWCRCSCLASSTPVEVGPDQWLKIGSIQQGSNVLGLNSDGSWSSAAVIFSDGSTMPEKPFPYAIYVFVKDGPSLITTPDHLFLLADKTLKRADRLTLKDKLLDKNLKAKSIDRILSGDYLGPLHNIAINEWANEDIYKHLINTSGVISADYFLETRQYDSLKVGPQVGTKEYQLLHGAMNPCVEGLDQAPEEITFNKDSKFIPQRIFEVPDGACPYLPSGQDEAAPGVLKPLDDTIPYDMAVYLMNHFKVYYPQINFQIHWSDDRVNAYAWKQGNSRYVAMLGGLLRHPEIGIQGAGLVFAHEIGHHYGGKPRYPDNPWASCEGQSDYWGALVAMRKVWWGSYALDQIKEGAAQLYNLFSFGLLAGNLIEQSTNVSSSVATACSHPTALCRYNTYLAAMRLDPKPPCAGSPWEPDVPRISETETENDESVGA